MTSPDLEPMDTSAVPSALEADRVKAHAKAKVKARARAKSKDAARKERWASPGLARVPEIWQLDRDAVLASMAGLPVGPHITRFYMYRHLEQQLAPVLRRQIASIRAEGRTPRTLVISGSEALCGIIGLGDSEQVLAVYPEYDISNLALPDESFDFIVSDQVLEHVEANPQTPFDESLRVLRRGGCAVHTTCFINPIHYGPKDLWRFTPEALRFLTRRFSIVIEADGWGNFDAWRVVDLGLRFHGVPLDPTHLLHRIATYNDSRWPIVTWVAARK